MKLGITPSQYVQYAPLVAEKLLGKPNPHHSKPEELRYGNNGSLKVNLKDGLWHCFETGEGGGVLKLIVREGGAKTEAEAAEWLVAEGIHTPEIQPAKPVKAREVAAYDYVDENGELLFQVVRYEPKTFKQRRPNGKGWEYKVAGTRQVPYRLPQLMQQPDAVVFIPEGEKDVDRLIDSGLVATCNAGGAGKWPDALNSHLSGRDVVILPDNDEPGEKHLDVVMGKLRGVAKSIRVVRLPGLPGKGDVSNWMDAGGTAAELLKMAKAAQVIGAEAVKADAKADDVSDVHNMTPVTNYEWPHQGGNGKPRNTRPNVEHLLNNYRIRVRYNEISKDVEVEIPGHRKSDASDNTAISEILSLAALNQLPVNNIEAHIKTIATFNSYNPVQDFIRVREWDGVSRFDDLLNTLETDDDFDRNLLALLVRKWMISAVAAAFNDGNFSSKGVLVFQGEQSIGKTAWFTALVPAEQRGLVKKGATIDPNNKDTISNAIGHWLVELGELDATFRKSDIARLKQFIDQSRDDLRRPYDRVESRYIRRTVFFASVNPKHFLVDETGNVRFWTIPVVSVNHSHDIDTQQLWAEVYTWFRSGERWWLLREEEQALQRVNDEHGQVDPMEEKILARFEWGSQRSAAYVEMTSSQVLMEIGYDQPNKSQATKCADILMKLTGQRPRKTNKGRFYMMPPKVMTVDYFNEQQRPF